MNLWVYIGFYDVGPFSRLQDCTNCLTTIKIQYSYIKIRIYLECMTLYTTQIFFTHLFSSLNTHAYIKVIHFIDFLYTLSQFILRAQHFCIHIAAELQFNVI